MDGWEWEEENERVKEKERQEHRGLFGKSLDMERNLETKEKGREKIFKGMGEREREREREMGNREGDFNEKEAKQR